MKRNIFAIIILTLLILMMILMIMQTSNDTTWGGGYWERWLVKHYQYRPEVAHLLVFYFRKTVHFIFYGILALVFQVYFRLYGIKRRFWVITSGVVAATIVASIDEYRQTLVSFRSGKIEDVILDFSGALCLTMFALWVRRYKKSSIEIHS